MRISCCVVSAIVAMTACAGESTPAPVIPPPSLPPPPVPVPALAAVANMSGPVSPATRRDDFHETLHGVDIVDPYRWLEDQESVETRKWVDAENAYTHALLDALPGRDAIRQRLSELKRYDDQGTPTERGGRLFFTSHKAAADLYVLHVKNGDADSVLVDPHPLSPDHTTDIELEDVSANGTRILYRVRRSGEDESELRVRDVATGADRADVMPRALYRGASLRPDGSGFYYALRDRTKGVRVRYHVLGQPLEKDEEVFGEGCGPTDRLGGIFSENGRHTIFSVGHGFATNDVFVQTPALTGPIKPIVQGIPAHVRPAYAGDRLIAQTDLGAPNGRIVEIDPSDPSPDHWRTIVPAGPDAMESFGPFGGRIVVQYLHDVAARLVVYGLDGKTQGEISLPGLGAVTRVTGTWRSDSIYVGFVSFATPGVVLRASVSKRTAAAIFRASVPLDADSVETKQVFYASKDGTRVPMFITRKKGTPDDGARPTVLYGYGGFDVAETPYYSAMVAWLIEHGGVYAVANLRGGGEYGEQWHKAGMLANKQNVFDDFIAAAEWLVAKKITSPDHLAIRGGSNGGLLVGAAMTQRPDLFRVVFCLYPDLDMLGYYRFKNNNPPALLEYGDASKPDDFKFLAAYSPYQKVAPGTRYPAVFLRTGDADTRSPPFQATKMTARVRAATTSGFPVVLLYDKDSGHAAGEPLGKVLDEASLELSFLASQLGIPVATANEEAR